MREETTGGGHAPRSPAVDGGRREGGVPQDVHDDWRDESPAARWQAVAVATGRRPPDVWFRGGTVLNVYTGRWERAEIWLAGRRIAYVGPDEPAVGPDTRVVDCRGRYLVPGYIEIHAHPFQLYSPRALGAAIAPRGTATLVSDTLLLWQVLGPDLPRALSARLTAPVRDLWGLRAAPQTAVRAAEPEDGDPDGSFAAAFGMTPAAAAALLGHPRIVQIFEWTNWAPLVRDGARPPWLIAAGLARGMAVDGHAPGASYRTLAALAAAGMGDCHESIRPEEVLDRVRLGLFAILRHSSLRPDLPALIPAAREAFARGFGHRLALTTDGPTPGYVREGFLDVALRLAMEGGLEPAQAYQLVTVNPAGYLGLDRYLGALAPGRLADINVLADPADPVPVEVWIDGRPVAREGRLLEEPASPDWAALGLGPRAYPLPSSPAAWLYRPGQDSPSAPQAGAGVPQGGTTAGDGIVTAAGPSGPQATPADRAPQGAGGGAVAGARVDAVPVTRVRVPVIELLNAVIARLGERELAVDPEGFVRLPEGEDLLYAALLDPVRRQVTRGLVAGFGGRVAGLASTYTAAGGLLVLGRDPAAMMQAARAVAGGGIALAEGGRVIFYLPLPIAGSMSGLPVAELAARCEELARLLRERGHRFHDPVYSLLFLSADHLPGPRLTPAGLWDVKRRRLLEPAQPWAT